MSSLITAISFARESNQWDKNEYTLDVQVEANAANAQRDGLQISHTFREKFSGVTLWNMPELTRLRSLLQATPGRKIVYVYAQDRLVRGEEGEDIFWLLVEFRRYGAEVRFHLNPVDTSTIAGKIQMLITGNEASNEIAKIIDRTWTRGRLRRMKTGKIPNSGPEKYGFKRIRETGKAEIVPEQAAVIRRCAELVEQGHGFSAVARTLNDDGVPSPSGVKWSAPTIHRYFQDPAYKGQGFGWQWSKKKGGPIKRRKSEDWIKLADDAYPAIVEPERWDRIHALMQRNRGIKARQAKLSVLLRGLIFCECGHAAYFTRGTNRKGELVYGFYGCGRWSQEYRRSMPRTCFARRRSAPELDAEIWSQVADLLRNPERILAMVTEAQPVGGGESLETEIEALEKTAQSKLIVIQRLAGRLRTAPDSVAEHIEREMQTVEAERRATERQVAELRRRIAERQSREASLTTLTDLVDTAASKIADAPPALKRKVLEALPFVYSLEGEVRYRADRLTAP